MLIPSIIALSLVLLISLVAFLTHNATNIYSYDYKSKPYKPLCVSSAIITLIGLAALVAAMVVSIIDEYDGIQTPLFFFGLVTSVFGVLQFYLYLVGFVGIKGNDIHIRVSFKTKKAKISDIKTILRGPYDFIIKLKDGYKAPFIGDDIVVNKIIERLDDEVLVMDFVDTSYLWNNPKKMKRNKILSIVGGIVSIFGLAAACVLDPFDKPIHEEDAILISGELDYSSYIGQYNYFFYLKGSDIEYQIPKEVGHSLNADLFKDLYEGDQITFLVEGKNNQKAKRDGFSKADRICKITHKSKVYLPFEGYRDGIFDKRQSGVGFFSFFLDVFSLSVISYSTIPFIEKFMKEIDARKKKQKDIA